MKTVRKPLDLMGLRLYRVVVHWPSCRDHPASSEDIIVAARSPTHAAEIISEHYPRLPKEEQPTVFGRSLDVVQPREWFEFSRKAPLDCDHHHFQFIQTSSGSCGPDNNWREDVSICQDCGQIKVSVTRNGQHSEVTFGLLCDTELRAAAKYFRTPEEQQTAIDRAIRHETISPSQPFFSRT